MQKRRLITASLVLASAAFPFTPPLEAPVPGPGGVIDAVTKFLAAVDQQDLVALGQLVDDQGDNLHDYATGGAATGKPVKASAAAFYECDATGKGWQAGDTATFLASLTTHGKGARTQVRGVRANCLAERCSYAMVEFERTTGEGDAAVTVPMRATALLRYAPTEGGPSFKIYHWHASRGSPAAASAPRAKR